MKYRLVYRCEIDTTGGPCMARRKKTMTAPAAKRAMNVLVTLYWPADLDVSEVRKWIADLALAPPAPGYHFTAIYTAPPLKDGYKPSLRVMAIREWL